MAPLRDGQESGSTQGNASQGLRSLCIVVADDDRDSVLTLMMLLRDEGHEVHGAYSSQQTLDAVLKFDADVVILDIALGTGSGFDVARQLRARHGDRRPMIIGISGRYKHGSDRVLGEINGMNHYLVKPYEAAELLGLLAPLRVPAPWTSVSEPRQDEDSYRAAIVRAAFLVGGARQLSDRLQVPMTELTRWVTGEGKPAMNVFLRVVDILVAESKKSRPELTSDVTEFPKPPDPAR